MTKEQVIELRKSLGLTQEQFAAQLHVSVGAVRLWEQGLRSPKGLYLKALLEVRQATLQGGNSLG